MFAYAILRAIPDKVVGVLALFISILVFFLFVVVDNYVSVMSKANKFLVWAFIFVSVALSWLGQCLVEPPFVFLRITFSFLYFFIVGFMFFLFVFFGKLFGCIYSIINMLGLGPRDFCILCFIIFIS